MVYSLLDLTQDKLLSICCANYNIIQRLYTREEGNKNMALVNAVCTSCGAALEVDNQKEAAVCPHCGAAYIVEKAIINYNTNYNTINNYDGATINVTGTKIENLLVLAKNAQDTNAFEEAHEYYARVLEVNPHHTGAIIGKAFNGLLKEPPMSMSSFGVLKMLDKAVHIELEKNPEDSEAFRQFMLSQCQLLDTVARNLALTSLQIFAKHPVDLETIHLFWNTSEVALDLFAKGAYFIEGFSLLGEENAMELYLDIQQYIVIVDRELLKTRMAITQIVTGPFGDSPRGEEFSLDAETHKRYLGLYNYAVEKLKEYMPDADCLQEEEETAQTSGGCYVATAIYGSYDCPEVWILRRFRDLYLRNFLWGRMLIKSYYTISPGLVRYFGRYKLFDRMFRPVLDRLVNRLYKKGYSDSNYKDIG